MWESRVVGEIPKESWEEWESCFWISILSTLRHFHGSPAAGIMVYFSSFPSSGGNGTIPFPFR